MILRMFLKYKGLLAPLLFSCLYDHPTNLSEITFQLKYIPLLATPSMIALNLKTKTCNRTSLTKFSTQRCKSLCKGLFIEEVAR